MIAVEEELGPSAHVLVWEAKRVLMEQTAWLDYVKRVYALEPFLTYVGVNFTKDTLKNFKFYFSFLRRLSDAEIDTLLPVPNRSRFDELYHSAWHPTHQYNHMHRGTTFALKVNPSGALTHYYHFRIPGLILGEPERLPIVDADRDNYHGVCEEFTGDQVHLKRYWYMHDRDTIAETVRIAGLDDLYEEIPTISMLEYIESSSRDKLEWITGSQRMVNELIYRRGPERLMSALKLVCRDCKVDLFGPGSARDGTDHALYLIDTMAPLHPGGYIFDGVRRFITSYLKLEDPGRARELEQPQHQ